MGLICFAPRCQESDGSPLDAEDDEEEETPFADDDDDDVGFVFWGHSYFISFCCCFSLDSKYIRVMPCTAQHHLTFNISI